MNTPIEVKRYKKVLLIDDDEVDIFISNKIIKATSLAEEVITKSSAEEGLNLLNSLKNTPADLPDIIFLDLGMPAMDGLEFLNEFRKLVDEVKTKCKIVVLTNSFDLNSTMISEVKKNVFVKKIIMKPLTIKALEEI